MSVRSYATPIPQTVLPALYALCFRLWDMLRRSLAFGLWGVRGRVPVDFFGRVEQRRAFRNWRGRCGEVR